MKHKLGRLVDHIATRSGTLISPFRVMQVVEEVPGVAQYKVIQDGQGRIEVQAVLNTGGISPSRTMKELEESCRHLFADTPYTIRQVDWIDAPGKGK